MNNIIAFATKVIPLHVGNLDFEFAYWEIGLIVVLVFLLFISMAHVRRHFVDGSLIGGVFGFVLGVVVTILVEVVLISRGVKIDKNILVYLRHV